MCMTTSGRWPSFGIDHRKLGETRSAPGARQLSSGHGDGRRSGIVVLPDIANRFFIVEPIRNRGAWRVGKIPTTVIERRCLRPASGHFEIAVRIGLPYPVPCIVEPLTAVLFALICEPTDFVVTPNPIAPLCCLAWMPAGAPVIEFHQIGKVLASPAAISSSTLAAQEETVEVTDLENGFLRTVGNLFHSQRKRMRSEERRVG